MKINIITLLFTFALIVHTNTQGNYKKVIHNYDPEAKCLDGSPGLLYVHEGGDIKNFLIFLNGGGLCGNQSLAQTLQSCYQRSKTKRGSSSSDYWPQQFTPAVAQGYLSTDPKLNKFASWTKFILGYCDGSLHQGYSKDPIKYKDTELYFRGAAITRSHFDWINSKYNLKAAQKIILTGASAGAIGTNLWSNYLKSYVNDPQIVYPIADSGALLNFKNYLGDPKLQRFVSNLFSFSNKQQSTPLPECNAMNKGNQWKCLFFQNIYPEIKGKFMVINSEYDSWAVANVTEIDCLKTAISGQTLSECSQSQLNYIEKYRAFNRQTLLGKFLVFNNQSSIWSIACSNHVYAVFNDFYDSPLQKIPTLVGKTVKNAVQQFVFQNKRVVLYDIEGWPSNIACA